eukprot:symbB.v1.2.003461.t1/scaffold194.1/size275082/22
MEDARALLIDVERQSSPKEIVATLGWIEEPPYTDRKERLDWSKVDITKSKFALLKAIKIKHPDLPEACDIWLHPPAAFDMEVTVALEDEDEILGFRVQEVKNTETGASELYDPQVVLRNGETTWLEPLSGHWFHPTPKFPGKVDWVPPTAKLAAGSPDESKVIGLRTMRGSDYDHIVGVIYSSSWSIRSLTGQSAFFWVDTLGLVVGIFYADIASDIKQLLLFYQKDLWDYCLFNFLGLLIPPIVSIREALRWRERLSPDQNFFKGLIHSDIMQKLVILTAILTQTYMLILAMVAIRFRKKHPLMESAKHAEVAESAISALVQSNFLMSFMVGIQSIASIEFSSADLVSIAVSISISCFSAGLSFASRDKMDSAVLGLPGKIGWGPTMCCLVVARSLEVGSKMFAFNLIHISIRGSWLLGHVGGPIAVGFFVAVAALCFPEAELTDILASVVAHPGQILQPHSLLPLRNSLMLHAFLVLAAGEFPVEYLIGWLLITTCSFIGLTLLSYYGSHLEQPALTALCEEDGSIYLSSFVAAFKTKDSEVAKAVVASLGKHSIKVDTGNLTPATFRYLADLRCPVHLPVAARKHLIHIFSEEHGEERGALDFFTTLQCCNLVSLDLQLCSGIHAAAWQKVRSANWLNLKKANFAQCFDTDTKGADGAADLLEALSQSTQLEELDFNGCNQIPAAAWQKVRSAKWLNLKKANFAQCFDTDTKGADGAADLLEALSQCFNKDTKGAEGAADLLEALSQSTQLEELDFNGCNQIPAAAWHKVRNAKWLNLKKADFTRCFGTDTKGAEGAADLLEALSQWTQLEELDFTFCSQIPAAAWHKVRNAKWLNLKKAKFHRCFDTDTKGAEGAADLLQALSQSTQLENLDFNGCNQIPAGAWQKVPDGAWPKLRWAWDIPEEELQRLQLGAEGATRRTPSTSTLEIAAGDSVALAGPRRLKIAVARELDSDAMEVMSCLSSSPIEVLDLRNCPRIPAAAWQKVRSAKWLNLKKADFYECFDTDTQGADGAADLLQALSQSTQLEELDIRCCSEIPAAAWHKVRNAKWLNLKKAKLAWCFGRSTKGAEGAADLVQALSQSPLLEELNIGGCSQMHAAVWQKLHGAKWLNLKKAHFFSCFDTDTKGAEGAADLLEALSQSPLLEELDFYGCEHIPAAAWQKVPDGAWPKLPGAEEGLRRLRGVGEVEGRTEGDPRSTASAGSGVWSEIGAYQDQRGWHSTASAGQGRSQEEFCRVTNTVIHNQSTVVWVMWLQRSFCKVMLHFRTQMIYMTGEMRRKKHCAQVARKGRRSHHLTWMRRYLSMLKWEKQKPMTLIISTCFLKAPSRRVSHC